MHKRKSCFHYQCIRVGEGLNVYIKRLNSFRAPYLFNQAFFPPGDSRCNHQRGWK